MRAVEQLAWGRDEGSSAAKMDKSVLLPRRDVGMYVGELIRMGW